ncbi:MAG: penicillin-binding protein 2, partial [Candidatus Dormibacteraeota bacterium]|nr:penicillin-binding protein 2 [Candidatus Dormibacteraeota bacterium]
MTRRRERSHGERPRAWFVGESTDFRRRGLWLVLAFAAMAIAVLGRLVQVQVLQSRTLAAAARAEHTADITLHGDRGVILDRAGRVLASNRTVYDVFVDPALVDPSQRVDVAGRLAQILGVDQKGILGDLQQPNQFDYVAKGVSQTINARLQGLDLPGVGTIPTQQRVYNPSPLSQASFASNLLGFVDADGNGQYGLEQYYNDVLSGAVGHESTLTDLLGNPIVLSGEQQVAAHNGDDLQLGLDSQLQFWSELALAKGVADSGSSSGTLLVMDPHTGSIRAWAQYPTFDANNYGNTNLADFLNLGTSSLYEPGSVMKTVTFAGALNIHTITPDTVIDERQTVIDGYLVHDWDGRSHGDVTMQRVLDLSLNNGAIAVQQMEGRDPFYTNMLAFGIGAPTGVDLAGEVNAPLSPQSSWGTLQYAEASFGQGVAVTPIEMLAAVNAVANGGVWVQPHVADSIVDPSSGHSSPVVPRTRRVMSAAAASTLSQMMVGVVDDRGAEGNEAQIKGYTGEIAGKTGTASLAEHGTYGSNVIVSFVGFMPVQNPQFTMMV